MTPFYQGKFLPVSYTHLGIDVDSIEDDIIFPTFEEALGILDLAIMRGESLKNYDRINVACNSNRLGYIRNHLIFLMAKIIEISLDNHNYFHSLLVENLYKDVYKRQVYGG